MPLQPRTPDGILRWRRFWLQTFESFSLQAGVSHLPLNLGFNVQRRSKKESNGCKAKRVLTKVMGLTGGKVGKVRLVHEVQVDTLAVDDI